MEILDILILGSGPAALCLASELAKQDLNIKGISTKSPNEKWENTYGIWASKISEVQKNNTCVILGCESVECMRLEAGGMANMELIEQVVPNSFSTSEYDVSKLLGSSRGNTSPLFENSIKIALQIFNGFNN